MGIWSWLIGVFGRTCRHEWEEYTVNGSLRRYCVYCPRVEQFEPDAGGWTAGHWDEVK